MNRPAQIKRPPLNKLILIEFLIVILSAGLLVLWDKQVAMATLYGGCTFVIPTAYFAWRSFKIMGGAKAQQVVHGFYKAEMSKFALTVAMFAGIFIIIQPQNVLFVFVSYGLLAVLHFIATGLVLNKPNRI